MLQLIWWCLGCALAMYASLYAAAADDRECSSADEVIYIICAAVPAPLGESSP
jgi:hypothetical protein